MGERKGRREGTEGVDRGEIVVGILLIEFFFFCFSPTLDVKLLFGFYSLFFGFGVAYYPIPK